ncbi:MAG TPA: prohibitin family protein [Bacteroidia bacterium]|nr:prohibitin family protein [Bacteroidia bacterium]
MKKNYTPPIPKSKRIRKLPLKLFSILFVTFLLLQSCVTVRPGEVGIITHYGKMQTKTFSYGRHVSGIFGQHVTLMNTRVVEYSEKLDLPTKEGLEISADMTLLYHLKPEAAQTMFQKFGVNYGKTLVVNNFIAVSREATLSYFAMDIIDEREALEKVMTVKLDSAISSYGIVVDALMLKDIDLPPEVTASIQEKVKAQQDLKNTEVDIEKQRMEQKFSIEKDSLQEAYAIEKQKQEAERTKIEANAKKASLDIVNSALTDKLIEYERIKITEALVASPNSKIIVTDGKSDVHVNATGESH